MFARRRKVLVLKVQKIPVNNKGVKSFNRRDMVQNV